MFVNFDGTDLDEDGGNGLDTGVAGVIIGRALYENRLTLSEALAAARGSPIA